MSLPLISIIIPCYNAEHFIDKTLNSVFGQSYPNIECIVINDGSTDNSEHIIEKWRHRHPRFKYFKQQNSGLSFTRNRGITESSGDFIYFLDADDLIPDHAIETLFNLVTDQIDIVFGKTAIAMGQSEDITGFLDHNLPTNKELNNFQKNNIKLVIENNLICIACNRLYRKSFVEKFNLRFKEAILHEDELWFFESIFHSNAVILSDKCTYFYNTSNSGSITNNFDLKNVESYLKILCEIYNAYYKNDPYNLDKAYIALYINHFKIIIVRHCLHHIKSDLKAKASKMIVDCFKTMPVENHSHLLSKEKRTFHEYFIKLSQFNNYSWVNFLKYGSSNNISKRFKRWFILNKNAIYRRTDLDKTD